MDFEGVKWIIGLFAIAFSAVLGGFYQLVAKMTAQEKRLSNQHQKLNDKIDAVKDDYVRRDDFHDHMDRQEKTAARIEESIKDINSKLDRPSQRP